MKNPQAQKRLFSKLIKTQTDLKILDNKTYIFDFSKMTLFYNGCSIFKNGIIL